jgi:hypothetical protein
MCPSRFNTERTERLSELCVQALLTTEDTEPRTGCCREEELLTRGEIFTARQEDENE